MTFANSRVLVTGATGFIGGALALRLRDLGAEVRGLARSPEKAAQLCAQGIEPALGNLADADSLCRAAARCDVVFHVAAETSGPALVQYRGNVTGTAHVVEAAWLAGVRRVVHVSTIQAYGFATPEVITEETPLRPSFDHYAQSKALGEAALFDLAARCGIEAVAVRPGMVYGPRSGFWTRTLFRLVKRPPAILPAGGRALCPVIYIDDLLDLMLLSAEHPAAVGQAFNGVSDSPPTLREFLGAYAAMAGHQRFLSVPGILVKAAALPAEYALRILGAAMPLRGMAALLTSQRVYSADKAKRLLGWVPHVSLAEGMACAESWLRAIGELPAE